MDTTTLTLLVWVAFIGITHLGKHFGFTQKQVAIWFAIVSAIGYTIFNQYLPQDLQAEVVLFVSSAVGTGKLIYDMISKDV